MRNSIRKTISLIMLILIITGATSCSRLKYLFNDIKDPDEQFLNDMTDRFCSGKPAIFAFSTSGEFETSGVTSSVLDAYIYTEDYVHGDSPLSSLLALLSDDLMLFGVTSEDPGLKSNTRFDREVVYESIKRGIGLVLEDETCIRYMAEGMKAGKITEDSPFLFDIKISENTEKSAYVIVTGRTFEGKKHFHTGDFVNLDDSPENILFGDVTLYADTPVEGAVGSGLMWTCHAGDEPLKIFTDLQDAKDKYLKDPSGKTWYDGTHIEYPEDSNPYKKEGILRICTDSALRSCFQYMGDGNWFMSDLITEGETFKITDEKLNDRLVEELYTDLSVGLINEGCASAPRAFDDKVQINTQTVINESGLTSDSEINSEGRFYYAGPRTFRDVEFDIDGDDRFYSDSLYQETDAKVNGVPYVQNTEFYDYVLFDGKSYCRHDTTLNYETAENFEGKFEMKFLRDGLLKDGTFIKAYGAVCSGNEYLLNEYMLKDKTVFVFTDESGNIICGYSYNDEGLTLCFKFDNRKLDLNIGEIFDFATDNSAEANHQKHLDSLKDSNDFLKEDIETMGLPDLEGELTRGDAIDNPHIVSKFRDYLKDLPPFTLEMITLGDSERIIYKCSNDGNNDSFSDYDHQDLKAGGNSYHLIEYQIDGIYYLPLDDGKYFRQRLPEDEVNEHAKNVLYNLGDALNPIREAEFDCAYNATLDGEEYIVEIWRYKGLEFMYFCKDGKIIGVRYTDTMGALLYSYVIDFKKEADMSLIKVPDMSD